MFSLEDCGRLFPLRAPEEPGLQPGRETQAFLGATMKIQNFARACGALVFSILLIGNARAQDCTNEASLKSSQPGAAVEISFRNASAESRRLYWLDAAGDRKLIAVIAPNSELKQPTSAGHAWVVTNDVEKCLYAVTAANQPATIDVGGTVVAQVAPPAAGVA